jgi:hypothetical protein
MHVRLCFSEMLLRVSAHLRGEDTAVMGTMAASTHAGQAHMSLYTGANSPTEFAILLRLWCTESCKMKPWSKRFVAMLSSIWRWSFGVL